MPNTSPIIVNDGSVDVTFSPDSVTGTHVLLANQAALALNKRELLHYDRPANGNTLRRSIRLNVPLTRVVASGDVIEMGSFKGEFVFPPGSTVAERQRILALAISSLSAAATTATVVNPEWFW